ncbi:MAG TPA: MarR family winged helix-turn-helix transcriptional regulator, partial [Chryseolinea sp.]|nr:MarR family winged helix-turn-helix transcriptional regulator [Chryseolinea sp.]
ATKELKIKQSEEFYFLSVIKNLKSPKKTEVIAHTVNERSNGLNIISNLIKQSYIVEQNDKEDRRSKRVNLTEKGDEILKQCYGRIHQVSELMFGEMTDEDVALCIQLLKNVEMKFSPLVQSHKGKRFEDIYEEVTVT